MKHRLLYILILVACKTPAIGQNQDFYLGVNPTFNYLYQKEQFGAGLGIFASKSFGTGQAVSLGMDWVNFKSQGLWNSNPNEDILGKRNNFSLLSLPFLFEQNFLRNRKIQVQLGAGFCVNYWHLYERSFNGLVSNPEYTEIRGNILTAGILGLVGMSYEIKNKSSITASARIQKDDFGHAIFSMRIGYRRTFSLQKS